MFKPARMRKYSVLLLQKDALRVVNRLHEEGLSELRPVDLEKKELEAFEATEIEKFASFNLTKVKRTKNILSAFKPKQSIAKTAKGFLGLEKKKQMKETENFPALKKHVEVNAEPVFRKAEEIDEKLKSLTEEENELLQEKKILECVRELDIELEELRGFENIEIIIGKSAVELSEKIREEIKKFNDTRVVKELGEKEITIVFSVATGNSEELLATLRKLGFERIVLPESKGKPSQIIKEISKKVAKINAEQEEVSEKARKLYLETHSLLDCTEELLEMEKSRQEAFSGAGKTEKTLNIDFFVPKEKKSRFLEVLEEESNGRVHAERVEFTDEEAPIYLKNPIYFRDYEFILKLYGLPEYNSIDPTFFIAIAYPIFFGLAFSDIGYGIMLAVLAIALRLTWGKTAKSIKHLTNIMIHGSLTTILFGWMFGSFFGDLGGNSIKKMALIDPLGKTATGESAALIFLGIMAGIGLIHLNLGLLLGFLEKIKKKEYKSALTDRFVFIIMEAGLVLLIAGMTTNYGALAVNIGIFLEVVSLILLFWGGGLLGVMQITGFLGNTLSYLRLAALSLATFAVAMSINIIAGLISPVPFIGAILAALILIFGHFANFVFNILSSFIHPLRLHFVEFFSYFYEGAGKEFRAFGFERKLTKKGGGVK